MIDRVRRIVLIPRGDIGLYMYIRCAINIIGVCSYNHTMCTPCVRIARRIRIAGIMCCTRSDIPNSNAYRAERDRVTIRFGRHRVADRTLNVGDATCNRKNLAMLSRIALIFEQ